MKWDDYRKAMDALPLSPDFQARTEELLRRRARETSEKEYVHMKTRRLTKIVAAAAAIALLTVSALAASRLMSPGELAEFAGLPLLAEAFQGSDALVLNESVETGNLRVTLAGVVSGADLDALNADLDGERTYAVVALESLDGTPLANPDFNFVDYTLTPLVAGFTPWSVNNWTLDAAAQGLDRDGVYYYLLDTQSLEMFADHTVYLAFYQGGTPSRESFVMAEDGTISFAEDFAGPHALFTLPLDESKADAAAVEAFMADSGFDRWWFTGEVPEEAEEPAVDDDIQLSAGF